MIERDISRAGVKQAIAGGEIIEQYPDDYPVPSLLMAVFEPMPLHVVVAWNEKEAECHIVTAYRSDLGYFQADLKTRRKS